MKDELTYYYFFHVTLDNGSDTLLIYTEIYKRVYEILTSKLHLKLITRTEREQRTLVTA